MAQIHPIFWRYHYLHQLFFCHDKIKNPNHWTLTLWWLSLKFCDRQGNNVTDFSCLPWYALAWITKILCYACRRCIGHWCCSFMGHWCSACRFAIILWLLWSRLAVMSHPQILPTLSSKRNLWIEIEPIKSSWWVLLKQSIHPNQNWRLNHVFDITESAVQVSRFNRSTSRSQEPASQ